MRIGWVIVGLILLILGAVLIIMPLFNQPISNVAGASNSVSSGTPAAFQLKSYGVPYYMSMTWSSSASTTVTVQSCSSVDPNTAACNGASTLASDSGTSGTLTWTAAAGAWIEISTTSSGSVTISVNGSSPLLGFILAIPGILVLIVGLVRKKKQKVPKGQPPAQAWQPGQQGQEVQPGPPAQWGPPQQGQWQQPPPQ
jgi:hypothetical protein